MRITAQLTDLAIKALVESVDVQIMVIIARKIFHNYDIYQRTGFPENIPIPKTSAATQIVSDIKKKNLFPNFVTELIHIHYEGHMGRQHPIRHLREIIIKIREQGLIYDQDNEIFVEDPSVRKTKNWGALQEGEEYLLAFLRFDIVGNSSLVREYSDKIIKSTYNDLKIIIEESIDKRNGRIWSWEGDGGLISFFFAEKHLLAVLSGMEILHRLFMYNQINCKLKKPLDVRFAVHSGPLVYSDSEEELINSDPIKKVMEIESKYTDPSTLTISDSTIMNLESSLTNEFMPIKINESTFYYSYSLVWEQ